MTERRFITILIVLLLAVTASAAIWISGLRGGNDLVSFRSYSELRSWLDGTYGQYSGWAYGAERGGFVFGGPAPILGPAEPGSPDYSGTNVQVAGIDELDIVKTDGSYMYLASGREVAIVRATPAAEMTVIARVSPAERAGGGDETSFVTGIFVLNERLVVVSSTYSSENAYLRGPGAYPDWRPPAQWTIVEGYDTSDIAHPALEFSFRISGSPMTARMIPPFAYLIVSELVTKVNETYELPRVCVSDTCAALAPEQIYYDPTAQETAYFTNLFALDASTGDTNLLSILTGYASTVYMSHDALFLTYTKWSGGDALFGMQSPFTTWTTIHKIRAEGLSMEPTATTDVTGTLLNQFSLDERAGYLRVFTTAVRYSEGVATQDSNLFVLDEALRPVGSLEGLAPGERIHSARFLGDRAYLVTFQKIDPFFAIDVSDPRAPRVLGYLKIPGYSDYLHPMDEDHILGIGKETVPGETGDFSWYQGLKLSLFNVSDVEHPQELGKYVIGDRGTDSEVLRDHKAFLSIPSRGLVVLPFTLALVNASKYPEPIPPYAYGDPVWQGAYVLSVSVEGGVGLIGRIAHGDASLDEWGNLYLDPLYQIRRSLYIGDTLYTISPSIVKANALDGLAEVGFLMYAQVAA